MRAAFFELHRDLPREGPGAPEDVLWAAELAKLPPNAQIADVGCGPGGDIAALLSAAPKGQVTALDKVPHFVAAARAAWRDHGRVTVLRADMTAIANPYDMIWCAGAVYFLGITAALQTWRKSLVPGGVVAFSEPCWFVDQPSARAKALWEAEDYLLSREDGIRRQVEEAGYEVLGARRLADQAWENYYGPLSERIAQLRPTADDALTAVLQEATEEVACWRAHRDEFGYVLIVARPRRLR